MELFAKSAPRAVLHDNLHVRTGARADPRIDCIIPRHGSHEPGIAVTIREAGRVQGA